MTIPGNLIAPLVAFDITSGGQFEDIAPIVVFGHKTSGGSMAENVETPCTTRAQARALAGKGSMLEHMMAIIRRNAPTHPVKIVAVPEVGVAEIRTLTVDAVPSNGGAGVLSIMGEDLTVQVASGATAAQAATAIASAINDFDNPQTGIALPFTATAAAAVVTITARHKGIKSNQFDIDIPVGDGSNIFTGNITEAVTTAGSGVPDTSTANAAIEETDWSFLITPFEDAANLTRYAALMNESSGRWAYVNKRFGHVYYPKRDTQSTLITHGDGMDDWHLTNIPSFSNGGFAQPDYMWLAGIVARVAPWLASGSNGDVSRNQTGLVVEGLLAPRNAVYWPDLATRNAFLAAGLSTWFVNGSGEVAIDKLITHHKTTAGVIDTTFRDVQRPHQLMYALRYFTQRVSIEHANKAIADENPNSLDAISTPSDVKATLFHAYQALNKRGILEGVAEAAKGITVTRNLDNPNRLDSEIPKDFTNPLDIFAGLSRVYSQFQ